MNSIKNVMLIQDEPRWRPALASRGENGRNDLIFISVLAIEINKEV